MDEKTRRKTSIVIDPAVIQKIPRSITISDAIEEALHLWLEWKQRHEDEASDVSTYQSHRTEHEMLDAVLNQGGEAARAIRTMLRALAAQAGERRVKQTKAG